MSISYLVPSPTGCRKNSPASCSHRALLSPPTQLAEMLLEEGLRSGPGVLRCLRSIHGWIGVSEKCMGSTRISFDLTGLIVFFQRCRQSLHVSLRDPAIVLTIQIQQRAGQ